MIRTKEQGSGREEEGRGEEEGEGRGGKRRKRRGEEGRGGERTRSGEVKKQSMNSVSVICFSCQEISLVPFSKNRNKRPDCTKLVLHALQKRRYGNIHP
jgi:hypothetical protein